MQQFTAAWEGKCNRRISPGLRKWVRRSEARLRGKPKVNIPYAFNDQRQVRVVRRSSSTRF